MKVLVHSPLVYDDTFRPLLNMYYEISEYYENNLNEDELLDLDAEVIAEKHYDKNMFTPQEARQLMDEYDVDPRDEGWSEVERLMLSDIQRNVENWIDRLKDDLDEGEDSEFWAEKI